MSQTPKVDRGARQRAKVLRQRYMEHMPPDQDALELLIRPGRFLLVESYPISGHCSLSTHDSPEEAADFHNESVGWSIEYLEDMETGKRFSPRMQITWEEQP